MAINTDRYILKVHLVDVVEFESYDPNSHKLKYAKLLPGEANRLAFSIKDKEEKKSYMFDYETSEQLYALKKDAYGCVEGPIYVRTKYITKIYNYPLVSDRLINDCIQKFNEIDRIAEKKLEGKIISFPKKQLI